MAWSRSASLLLVWNLLDGMDVYRIRSQDPPIWVARLSINMRRNIVVQVALESQGRWAICGSDCGEIYVWDIDSQQRTQVLMHGKGAW